MDESPECAAEFCLLAPSKAVFLDLANKIAPNVRRICPTGIALCGEHAEHAKIDDFLNGEIWSELCAKFAEMKLPPPTPKLARLELRDIDEAVAS